MREGPKTSFFTTMSNFHHPWFLLCFFLNLFKISSSSSCCSPHNIFHPISTKTQEFKQKTADHHHHQFWEFDQTSNSWVKLKLPYDLVSCINDNCTRIGSIVDHGKKIKDGFDDHVIKKVPLSKKRPVWLMKVTETNSIWVIGQSGSIYERFWNGIHWVMASHDLPTFAAPAVSLFNVNHTILALSQLGLLFQLSMDTNFLPVWIALEIKVFENQSDPVKLKSGEISHDRERVYFCTTNGSLIELNGVEPLSWVDHGEPPGGNVAAIVDAGTIRSEVIFIISSNGDLYEHDKNSKPSWKKHIWVATKDTSLLPSRGCAFHDTNGPTLASLFLLNEGGNLVERRLQQRKWKWVFHGCPNNHHLTSIAPFHQYGFNAEFSFSLFLTTASGHVLEYRLPKHRGTAKENQGIDSWVDHKYPDHARVSRNNGGIGIEFQVGRLIFALDDGRLGELHLPGIGGKSVGPTRPPSVRRKSSLKYVWSVLDAPETEGWNSQYCTEERGPLNCIEGIQDESIDIDIAVSSSRTRRGSKSQQNYMLLLTENSKKNSNILNEEINVQENWIQTCFRLRLMVGGMSFFMITETGLTFEYINVENFWFWLRYDHWTAIRGVVASYNGSLFVVDEHGSLFLRERGSNELGWLNCTSLRKGKFIIGGPPWDGLPGNAPKVSQQDDGLFFVSKTGRLLQFTVAMRKYKWKDCRHPPKTKVAAIVDQEIFRNAIVFVVGENGRLYQYNKITEKWHEHYQSQHLVLSRQPGTAMRLSPSLSGSLFMISKDGGLVEYHWNALEGWNWVEHGTPYKDVNLVGSPGPSFQLNQLFLIGSDGNVYLRYIDKATWKWKNCGHPHDNICFETGCDPKIAPTRPIPFSEHSVIFQLRDGRLGEMERKDEGWVWLRTIGTPTSTCMATSWTDLASSY